ncbi:flagellar biosynthesis protein FlhB [Paenibacillus sp. ACRRX]|uniref:flagellar biosynthesis protein FlhB n=1 Tax=unclassified Paenibacillus TaxID=185978 RepID=UPI001EF5F08D|nr:MULTISPECIES: flagellar biosynthesis protein FlhB [unclassified Paenibacillus]MCG7407479.1 flagellar biosynthesis protein FlhB [Paenibacillus sp. ACRRX]MDK8180715.1 flagellar biosynthesis protein FlhB [Paenibacillus sp. UMB4589-SE434]
MEHLKPKYRLSLDLQLFSQEKTEKATPKKRDDSRKKGQVAKSMDLSGSFILLISFMSLFMLGGFFKERLISMFSDPLQHRLNMQLSVNNIVDYFGHLLVQFLILLAPIFIVAVVMGLLVNYMQIGFLFTGEPLKMQFSKIDPIKGFKNIFSMRSVVEFLKSIIKLTVIGVIAYISLWGERDRIIELSHVPLGGILSYTAELTVMLGIKTGAALTVLAVFDYMYQKYEFEKSIRMSKQDIKDEYKKMEGDPLIKGKIKERQRRMALMRMMQEVPNADVVITNPTHFAIALRYEGNSMEAPKVIAKGQDYVALKIKAIAQENGVMTMENRPLARALYERTEIGDSIPADLFQAVAEVLAYVYKLKGKAK